LGGAARSSRFFKEEKPRVKLPTLRIAGTLGQIQAASALVVRKATLASVLAKAAVGIRFNEHMEFDDGENGCRAGMRTR
jgi:hypothetical protein